MMSSVDRLMICVRNDYLGSDDYLKIRKFFETMYISNRIGIPLKEVVILGY